MKKAIIITCLTASLLLILNTGDTLNALLLFLTVGVIPGTAISLSPSIMLFLITSVSAYIIASLIFDNVVRTMSFRQFIQTQLLQKRDLPHRRFSDL